MISAKSGWTMFGSYILMCWSGSRIPVSGLVLPLLGIAALLASAEPLWAGQGHARQLAQLLPGSAFEHPSAASLREAPAARQQRMVPGPDAGAQSPSLATSSGPDFQDANNRNAGL